MAGSEPRWAQLKASRGGEQHAPLAAHEGGSYWPCRRIFCERRSEAPKGSPGAIFWRSIEHDNLIVAEGIAREFDPLPLDFAFSARSSMRPEGGSEVREGRPPIPRAVLVRREPSLSDMANVAVLLVEKKPS